MVAVKIFLFLLYAILVFANEERGLFFYERKAERGIFFYDYEEKKEEEIKEEKEKEKEEKFEFPVSSEAPPVVQKFLKNPTEENAREFLKWQYQYMMHLYKIGAALRSAFLKEGKEIYPVMGYPESVLVATLYPELREELFKRAIQKVKDKVGLLYFFSSRCKFCELQSPLVEKLYRDYGISLRGVSIDGGLVPYDFPQVVNPELARNFGISQVPAIVMVIEREGKAEFELLSLGFTPLDQIKANMIRILIYKGLINPSELNVNFFGGG